MRARFRRIALLCAIVAFGLTSLLALAGADWPPPAGFLWLEGLLAVLSVIAYLRVLSRLDARRQGRRVTVAALDGVIAALAAGFALVAVHADDRDVALDPQDHLVWILTLGLAGAVAAQLLWGLAVWVDRLTASPSPDD